MLDEQRDACLRFTVKQEVDGIKAGQVKFQLLECDDEVARAEVRVAGEHDFRWQVDAGHDGAAVGIHEIEPQFVRAFVFVAERDAQGDGALRMRGRDLLRDDGVESAEKVELSVLFRGGIAQNSDLDIHRGQNYLNAAEWARNSLSVRFAIWDCEGGSMTLECFNNAARVKTYVFRS